MKSIEWLDKLIAEKNLPSDRQAALLIGMGEPLMSKHRNGKVVTLDNKYSFRVEKALGLPRGALLSDQQAEREKDPEVAKVWRELSKLAMQNNKPWKQR